MPGSRRSRAASHLDPMSKQVGEIHDGLVGCDSLVLLVRRGDDDEIRLCEYPLERDEIWVDGHEWIRAQHPCRLRDEHALQTIAEARPDVVRLRLERHTKDA